MEFAETYSICNECYKKIPARIHFEDDVVKMRKICCSTIQEEIMEKSIPFYETLFRTPYTNILGNTCIIPITYGCNISCKACYCKLKNRELNTEEVIGISNFSPTWIMKFMLTGGEPTTHTKFLDIVSNLDCGIITNGIKFADINFLKDFSKFKVYSDQMNNEIAIMFSLNTIDSPGYEKKLEAIENVRRLGLKLYMVCATISDLEEIPGVLSEFNKIKDVVSRFKIRSVFNIGETTGYKHIYLSEMAKCVCEHSNIFRFLENMNSNTYLMNTKCDDIHLILVKCPDKTTIDLCNIGPTGPFQYTDLNTFEDVMVALIVNEGIERGWMGGKRIEGEKA